MAHYSQSFVAKYGLSVSAAEDSTTNANYFPLFGTQSVGVLAIKASSTKLSFNPSSGLLSATAFAGNGAALTNLNISNITAGVLPIARGGSGTNLATGTGNNVLATGPVLESTTLNVATVVNGAFSVNNGFTVNGGSVVFNVGLLIPAGAIEIGRQDGTAQGALIDFHSSGNANDYDSRIIGTGGSAASQNGSLSYFANSGHNFTGAIYSTGDITAFSDITLKTDIEQISNALARVLSWQGVTYRLKESGEFRRGVIAQQIQEQTPDLVIKNPDNGLLAVMYQNMAADFIEAFRELNAKVEKMEARIKELEAR